MGDLMKELRWSQSGVLLALYVALVFVGMGRAYINESKQAAALPVNGKHIVIDAGHGGADPGKVSADGVEEKGINLAVCDKLISFLEQGGALVTPTRLSDEAVDSSKRDDLKGRALLASSDRVDLFVSIHQNSFPSSSAKGAQVFYYKRSESGKKLAMCIQKRLKAVCDIDNTRQAKANSEYYILKKSSVPAVIVECGFLSNGVEKEKLQTDEYQEKLAWAIYMGILDYYGMDAH
jgi:N-acetylmuramoyl-L-alanine amidase